MRESRAVKPVGWRPEYEPLADRDTERWRRIRSSLCPFHGLSITLDEYADRIVVMLKAEGAA